MKDYIIAVDFDGTCVEHRFPNVGKDVPYAADVLRALTNQGVKIMLWTMRSNGYLLPAVKWFADKDIPLWGINRNPTQHTWSVSNKQYANLYIDDAALGVPLTRDSGGKYMVDWHRVSRLLDVHHFHIEPIHKADDVNAFGN